MRAIAYWDMDRVRIKRILAELEAFFELRMASTLGELRAQARDSSVCALIIGLPAEGGNGIASFFARFEAPRGFPLFILGNLPLHCKDRGDIRITTDEGCLLGPGEYGALKDRISLAVQKRSAAELRLPHFIGRSKAMAEVKAQAASCATRNLPVLILGETGTGKELVARTVHGLSSRSGRDLVALNCAALPENLVESELFGVEKGAYTDAQCRRGALARASGGSLFLDEIGSMALSVQPKLLRALEIGEYWRLGGERPEKSEFRLICATGEDLWMGIEKGIFRKDLFYRIAVLPIKIPALRERPEDIRDLALHFCNEASDGLCNLSDSAIEKLMSYPWPGNVRELKSVICRACAYSHRGMLGPDEIIFIYSKAFSSSPA